MMAAPPVTRPEPSLIPVADELVPGEVDLMAFASVLLGHLRVILGCGLVAFLLMLGAMLLAKPTYTALTTVIVPQQNPAAASLRAQISAVAPLDLLGGGFEIYTDILRSRRVQDGVIQSLNLMKVYHAKDLALAELQLAGSTGISAEPEGKISISVVSGDPKLAAQIANQYIRELQAVNAEMVLTSVGQQRLFLQQELAKEKATLETAENSLAQTQENMHGLPPQTAASASVGAVETLRAQLSAAQVRLSSLLAGETEQNPEVVRQRAEIARLQGELSSTLRGSGSDASGMPISQVPQQTLAFERGQRDVKFNETLYDLLAREYEQAKLDEAKSPAIVQVLDLAVPPTHKSGPKRTVNCVIALFGGLLVGTVWVLGGAFVRKYLSRGDNRRRLAAALDSANA